jgi:hypothetical protein
MSPHCSGRAGGGSGAVGYPRRAGASCACAWSSPHATAEVVSARRPASAAARRIIVEGVDVGRGRVALGSGGGRACGVYRAPFAWVRSRAHMESIQIMVPVRSASRRAAPGPGRCMRRSSSSSFASSTSTPRASLPTHPTALVLAHLIASYWYSAAVGRRALPMTRMIRVVRRCRSLAQLPARTCHADRVRLSPCPAAFSRRSIQAHAFTESAKRAVDD